MPSENDEPSDNMSEGRNEVTPSLLPEILRHLGLDKPKKDVSSQASLLADLVHPSWYVRATAVKMLGELGTLVPLASLLAALDDPHPSVRANAVLALSAPGKHAPVERLVQVLQSDEEWQVRESAVHALANLGQLTSEDALRAALNDPDTNVRQAASQALAQFQQELSSTTRPILDEAIVQNHHKNILMRTLPGISQRKTLFYEPIHQEDKMSEKDFLEETEAYINKKSPQLKTAQQTRHPLRRVIGLSISAAVLVVMLLSWALIANTLRGGKPATSVGSSSVPTLTPNTSPKFSGKTLFTYTPSKDSPDMGSLMTIGWSATGRYISVSGIDITLLNATNGKVARTLGSLDGSVWVSWSSDGTRLVSSSTSAQVWDVKTGTVISTFTPQPIQAFTIHGGNPMARLSGGNMIYASAFSPDGKYVASAIDGNGIGYDVQIWNAATGAYIRTLQIKANANASDYINQVGWSHDGKYIAANSPNNGVIVWDASSGQHVYTRQNATVMTWAPLSNELATGDANGLVQIWQATTGAVQSSFQGQKSGEAVAALAWSPDGKYIAASGHDVHVWDLAANKLFGTYTGQGNDPNLNINGLAWSPDSKKIASLGTGMHETSPNTGYPLDAVKVWSVIA